MLTQHGRWHRPPEPSFAKCLHRLLMQYFSLVDVLRRLWLPPGAALSTAVTILASIFLIVLKIPTRLLPGLMMSITTLLDGL